MGSANSLLDNLILAAKGHYKEPEGTEVSKTDFALMIFREWTGTPASTFANLLSVILPIALAEPHFKEMSPRRMAEFMISLFNGHGHFGYDAAEDRFRRAMRMLMDEFTMIHRDHWLGARETPKPDPSIQRLLLNFSRAQPV